MSWRQIELRGVEVHNLKKVNLDLPHHQLIVFCGVSGSGKTSLALDTLYAEGQRRYIDSFSVYSRQFLERLEKPTAERIDGLPAALAVTHENAARSTRSTIGTATETADYLRLLFARVGKLFCRGCGKLIQRDTPQSAAVLLSELAAGTRFMIAFPRDIAAGESTSAILAPLVEAGFVRGILDGTMLDFKVSSGADLVHGGTATAELLVVVDRLVAGTAGERRLIDSLETAFAQGNGVALVLLEDSAETEGPAEYSQEQTLTIDNRTWQRLPFCATLRCLDCKLSYAEPEPRHFSFNSPLGACSKCEGAGTISVEVPATPVSTAVDSPEVSPKVRTRKISILCDACQGRRVNDEALAWRLGDKTIADILSLRIADAIPFLRSQDWSSAEQPIARDILAQLDSRLGFLEAVGLEYLSLDRTIVSLSGGEAQRVALTSALGSSLVNMLYVLDEPSVGLHPADLNKLALAIQKLKSRGNTVVVVEHEESLIRAADQIVEIGPGAGENGGQVAFQGSPNQMLVPGASLTGEYLAGRRGVSVPEKRRPLTRGRIRLIGARGNNLKNITVEFPLGVLCLVTGVSGAGKSSLVQETLYGAICRRKQKESTPPLPYDDVIGDGPIDDVILMDQSPIGRSPRSNPVTYIKIFDAIRAVFAETVEARTHNYGAGHFSFNVDGGRCNACAGDGYKQIDMQFLPDVLVKCKECGGTRYRKEILAITYRGKNIAEVLELTAREAFSFFRGQPKVQGKLKHLMDVGLDYLHLGQPATTLSTGEAQRLKLAAYLGEASRSRTLFLLDEPTTGLHFADIVKLLDCFDALLGVGHSFVIVEHNLQLMKAADYLIDLGPGAGDQGGQVVAAGTPEEIAACEASITGRFLRQALGSTAT